MQSITPLCSSAESPVAVCPGQVEDGATSSLLKEKDCWARGPLLIPRALAPVAKTSAATATTARTRYEKRVRIPTYLGPRHKLVRKTAYPGLRDERRLDNMATKVEKTDE